MRRVAVLLCVACLGCASAVKRDAEVPMAPSVPLGIPRPTVTIDEPPLPTVTRVDLDREGSSLAELERVLPSDGRYTLSVVDADLREILRMLSDQTGQSIVLDPDVDRRASVSIHEASLGEALSAILSQLHLSARVDGDTIRVGLPPMVTAALHLAIPAIAGDEAPDPWSTVEPSVRMALSPRGTLHADPIGSVLVVRDLPSHVDMAERVLRETIAPFRRQVMIEAMILEVDLQDEFEYGIDWTAPDISTTIGDNATTTSASTSLAPDSGVLNVVFDSANLDAVLNALRRRGKLNVLSAPRLTTMHRVPASIAVTEEIPYYTSEFAALGQDAVQNFTLEFRTAGITLEVSPSISAAGEIVLTLSPTITELTGFTAALDGLPPNPILDTRQVTTMVRARSGESVVIAGLIRRRYIENRDDVPGLGAIPGLGAAFRRLDQEAQRSELVMIITPVVADRDVRKQAVEESVERIEDLRAPYSPGMIPGLRKKDR